MKKFIYFAGALLACTGAMAHAQEPQNAPEAAAQQSSEEDQSEEDARMQETVCRTERVTGSRTRVNRTCMTRAEWRELERGHAENLRTLQGRASGAKTCASDPLAGC